MPEPPRAEQPSPDHSLHTPPSSRPPSSGKTPTDPPLAPTASSPSSQDGLSSANLPPAGAPSAEPPSAPPSPQSTKPLSLPSPRVESPSAKAPSVPPSPSKSQSAKPPSLPSPRVDSPSAKARSVPPSPTKSQSANAPSVQSLSLKSPSTEAQSLPASSKHPLPKESSAKPTSIPPPVDETPHTSVNWDPTKDWEDPPLNASIEDICKMTGKPNLAIHFRAAGIDTSVELNDHLHYHPDVAWWKALEDDSGKKAPGAALDTFLKRAPGCIASLIAKAKDTTTRD